jgi:hypothetical protein
MGPVDYIVVEFPGSKVTGQGFRLLVDLTDRGIIRVLDLIFVTKGADGSTSVVAVEDLDGDGELDLTVFDGASSGLLGPEDVAAAGEVLASGSTAALLVYENAWAAPLAMALRHSGAQLVASGRIPIQAILAELDASDADASRETTLLGRG